MNKHGMQLELKFIPTLLTIGIDGRSREELAAVLTEYGANVIVDVRHSPDSSPVDDFRRKGLLKLSQELGLRYQWEITLTDTSKVARQVDLTNERGGMKVLGELLRRYDNVCLLCSERDAADCHRSYIAEKLGSIVQTETVHIP